MKVLTKTMNEFWNFLNLTAALGLLYSLAEILVWLNDKTPS